MGAGGGASFALNLLSFGPGWEGSSDRRDFAGAAGPEDVGGGIESNSALRCRARKSLAASSPPAGIVAWLGRGGESSVERAVPDQATEQLVPSKEKRLSRGRACLESAWSA